MWQAAPLAPKLKELDCKIAELRAEAKAVSGKGAVQKRKTLKQAIDKLEGEKADLQRVRL